MPKLQLQHNAHVVILFKDDAFSDDEDGLEERPIENETEVIQPSHAAPVCSPSLFISS